MTGGADVFVAPFADIKSFHGEYKTHCEEHQTPPAEQAALSTFTSAYNKLHGEGVRTPIVRERIVQHVRNLQQRE